jgi:hypothetical protein
MRARVLDAEHPDGARPTDGRSGSRPSRQTKRKIAHAADDESRRRKPQQRKRIE